jgi:hypothetical protein
MIDMTRYGAYLLVLATGAALVVLVRAAVVPGWMSGTTFGGVVFVAGALAAVALMSLRAGRSTRSVAHVIHDAEAEIEAGRGARRTGGR